MGKYEELREKWNNISERWKVYFTKKPEDLVTQDPTKIKEDVTNLINDTLELGKEDELTKGAIAFSMIAFMLKGMQDPNAWNEWMRLEKEWWTDPKKLKMRIDNIKKL